MFKFDGIKSDPSKSELISIASVDNKFNPFWFEEGLIQLPIAYDNRNL